MHTEKGRLADVYDLLIDVDACQFIAGRCANASVVATVQGLRVNTFDPTRVVDELLQLFGTNDAAPRAIYEFASKLPPE